MKKKVKISILILVLIGGVFYRNTTLNAEELPLPEESDIDSSVIITTAKEVVRAGTYFISISTMNELQQKMSKMVRVHVKFPRTILDYSKEEGIDAHDIVVETGTFKDWSNSEAIQKADARAWSLITGRQVDISNVNITEASKDSVAIRTITYTTEKGTQVTSSVYEQDEINLGLDEVYEYRGSMLVEKIGIFSSIVFALLLLPILFNLVLIQIVKHTYKKTEKTLYEE